MIGTFDVIFQGFRYAQNEVVDNSILNAVIRRLYKGKS